MSKEEVIRYKISKASLHKEKQTTHTHKFLIVILLPLTIFLFGVGWIIISIDSLMAK